MIRINVYDSDSPIVIDLLVTIKKQTGLLQICLEERYTDNIVKHLIEGYYRAEHIKITRIPYDMQSSGKIRITGDDEKVKVVLCFNDFNRKSNLVEFLFDLLRRFPYGFEIFDLKIERETEDV